MLETRKTVNRILGTASRLGPERRAPALRENEYGRAELELCAPMIRAAAVSPTASLRNKKASEKNLIYRSAWFNYRRICCSNDFIG